MKFLKDFYKLIVIINAEKEQMSNLPNCEVLAIQSFKYCYTTQYPKNCFNNLPITLKQIFVLCCDGRCNCNEEFKNEIVDMFKLPFGCEIITMNPSVGKCRIDLYTMYPYTLPKDIFDSCSDNYAIFNCYKTKQLRDTKSRYYIISKNVCDELIFFAKFNFIEDRFKYVSKPENITFTNGDKLKFYYIE